MSSLDINVLPSVDSVFTLLLLYRTLQLFCFLFVYFFSEKPIYGFVSDYVYLIRGLLDLYEASLDEQWLAWAAQLQDKLDQLFWDSNGGGYFEVTNEDPSILLRLKEGNNTTAVPS